jgi:hypothetical protein
MYVQDTLSHPYFRCFDFRRGSYVIDCGPCMLWDVIGEEVHVDYIYFCSRPVT